MSAVMSMPLTSPVPPAAEMTSAAVPQGSDTGGQFQLPTMGMPQLSRNPQLPQHPLGAYTDSLYEAQVAQLRQDIASQYNDVLQQLGYTDDNGNFVPGTLEIDANKQKSDLARSSGLADEQVTHQHQQEGTLFSGLRGTDQARSEFPFQSALADLNVSVPRQLTDLYGKAGDLVNQFTTQHNLLLAQAAQRAAANLANNAAAGGNATGAPDPNAVPPTVPTIPGSPPVGPGLPSIPQQASPGGFLPQSPLIGWQPPSTASPVLGHDWRAAMPAPAAPAPGITRGGIPVAV